MKINNTLVIFFHEEAGFLLLAERIKKVLICRKMVMIFLSPATFSRGALMGRALSRSRLPGLIKIICLGIATVNCLLLLVQSANLGLSVCLIYVLPSISGSFLPSIAIFLKDASFPVSDYTIARCRRLSGRQAVVGTAC